ncbi:DUF1186 domain-containing protein [Thiohalorhabdus sp.]|uniref:DUF1186 domain-containing protein n=1 Tax=Thiohalorhabdus sp. TaxID=3094134 RepID=UPI002FC398C7
MEPLEIRDAFDAPYAPYQREAVDAAVAQREAVTPLLLERLESVVSDPHGWAAAEDRGPFLLYLLVLLTHFRETRAHSNLLALATLPGDLAEELLGDALSELLPFALWRTSGGDPSGLWELARDREIYGYGRWAALSALTEAAHLGELDAEVVKATLGDWLAQDDFAAREDPAWEGLMINLLSLDATEHEPLLRRRVREGYVHWTVRESEIDHVFSEDREARLAEAREWAEKSFSEDVHRHLSDWASLQPGFWDDLDEEAIPGDGPLTSGELPPVWDRPGGNEAAVRPSTKPAGPDPKKKKAKRKQQKQARKGNRKKK